MAAPQSYEDRIQAERLLLIGLLSEARQMLAYYVGACDCERINGQSPHLAEHTAKAEAFLNAGFFGDRKSEVESA